MALLLLLFTYLFIYLFIYYLLNFIISLNFKGQYIGGEKYGKKTETEKRGPSTVSITPVNSTAPGPEPESVSSPSFSEIKRRFSTTTTAADASKASEATAEGDKK